MNYEKLKNILAKVELACNDQIPRGITLAWSSVTNNVEWSEIREALQFAASKEPVKKVPLKDNVDE